MEWWRIMGMCFCWGNFSIGALAKACRPNIPFWRLFFWFARGKNQGKTHQFFGVGRCRCMYGYHVISCQCHIPMFANTTFVWVVLSAIFISSLPPGSVGTSKLHHAVMLCYLCVRHIPHILGSAEMWYTNPRINLPFGNVFKTLVGSLCGRFMDIMDIMAGFPIYFCLEISGNCWSRRSVRNMCRSKPLRLWCVPPWSHSWRAVTWRAWPMHGQGLAGPQNHDYLSLAAHMILNHPYGSGQDNWLTFVILCNYHGMRSGLNMFKMYYTCTRIYI